MTLSFTCKCGKKLRVKPEHAGKTVRCPGCQEKVQAPLLEEEPPELDVAVMEEDEIELPDLGVPASAAADTWDNEIPLQEITQPRFAKETIEEDDGAGYGLDADDGRANLDIGVGMYGTIAVIRLDEQAPCIAYGCKGDWGLAGQENDVLVVNMKEKKKFALFEDHDAPVTSVAMSTTDPIAVSADEDGELRYWSLKSCKTKKTIRAHKTEITGVALSPDGNFAASGGVDGCIRLFELATGKRRDLEHADWGEVYDEEVTYVTFSRDGSKLLAGGDQGRVCMWSVATGERIKRYAGQEMPISCIRLSDEGGRITATTAPIAAQGYSYLVIAHWDAKTGKPINDIKLRVGSIPCCFAPDRGGIRVMIGGAGPWLGVFNMETGHCLHIYEELRGTPLSLAVAPLNNRVLAALANNRLQLFGLEPY